jgi:SNF2 family DNA or RNA helicase
MNYLIQPWKHQLEAIDRARDVNEFALFFEMGAGKTMTAINILREKCNRERKLLRTLILCPPIVIPNWRDEWLKNSKIEKKDIILLQGTGAQRLALLEKLAFRPTDDMEGNTVIRPMGKIVIANYETLNIKGVLPALLRWGPEAVVYDESHKLKNIKSVRTKQSIELSAVAKYRYILSGSPVLNSPLDLFAQFLVLDGGETFGKNFFAFRGRYFYDKNSGMPKQRYFPNWQILPGAADDINEKIYRKAMRVEKKDCLDLPPYVTKTIKVSMTPRQEELYKSMKKDFIAVFNDKAITATLAITKGLRLQQIASGYVKDIDGEEHVIEKESPKQAALKELLEELTPNHKVLIWAVWKANYEAIRDVCRGLNIEFVEVHGEVGEKDKLAAVDRFNSDSKCRVFIGHPGSGGIGINLVSASYSIFYSRNFSLEHSLQAEARNYRGGSNIHEKVTRIDLVTEGTIDEIIAEKLAKKEEVSYALLRDISLELGK